MMANGMRKRVCVYVWLGHCAVQQKLTQHCKSTVLLFYSILFCSVLFCSVLSCPVLSCPVLSCPVLSCPILSYPILSYSILFYSIILILWLHLQHVEVPRLGVELELQLPAYTTAVWALSGTYATAHGNARSLTLWVRPAIEPASSWILVKFVLLSHNRNFTHSNFF